MEEVIAVNVDDAETSLVCCYNNCCLFTNSVTLRNYEN